MVDANVIENIIERIVDTYRNAFGHGTEYRLLIMLLELLIVIVTGSTR